jgi:hypothetical protein
MIESIVQRFDVNSIYTKEDIHNVIAETGINELLPGLVFDQVYQLLLQRGVAVIFDVDSVVFHLDVKMSNMDLVVDGAYCEVNGKLIYVDHYVEFNLVRDGRTLDDAKGHLFSSDETVVGLTELKKRLDRSV